ncbi:UNVERIFIED_CONTAM: hypothetical protein GTU68_031884 [Idotea baltica]|nr:hypothetical protein [Idotea baltica]
MNTPINILQQYWGFNSFRPLQADIINSVLAGNNVLALMPTGGGKSLCYQVPALCFENGVTLVISPLIALMKDQVKNLKEKGINAAALYAGQHYREMERILDNAQNDYLRILYVSPERLKTDLLKIRLLQMKINLVAIDEAHCVSQWGYDFRPAYLEIKELKTVLPNVPFIALTATATPRVKQDIIDKLELKNVEIFATSFTRKNLSYSVLYEDDKLNKLTQIFKRVAGTGIVYVRSRKKTETIADHLNKNGISAGVYHAGLSSKQRDISQKAWMNNTKRVIVCTNAFGMGIDKPDVRTVVHIDTPESLEAYFQEAGRAGRDGEKAFATLLYQASDKKKLLHNLERSFPDEQTIITIYNSLCNHFKLAIGSGKGQSYPFYISQHASKYNLNMLDLFNALNIMQSVELIHLSESYYEPSKIKIILSRENLYQFQIRQQQYNYIIKYLLRTLDGIMTDFIAVREQLMASQLKMSVKQLISTLHYLNSNKVISYIPQHDQPMLTFVAERLANDNISFQAANLAFRKQVKTQNIEAIINYVEEKNVCRNQQLLSYFGEQQTKKCGICDVCYGRNNKELSKETISKIYNDLKPILAKQALPLNSIITALPKYRKEQIAQALSTLIDRNDLFIDENNNIKLP